MCTGRVDLSFIFRALSQGADGVFIGGCWPGECHYITEGNYDALGNVLLTRKLLTHLGIDPRRVRIEWVAASEGSRFAEVMDDFVGTLRMLGPLGLGEGLDAATLKARLAAVTAIVPYLRLVERERLRVPHKTEQAYIDHYDSDEVTRLFDELIADKLAVAQIMALLADTPLSTGDISARLDLTPSAVARHMNASSRHGLVRFDSTMQRYTLA